ncbi:MAG: hypothetical protein LBK74_00605 [Treponema sp.]|jgi:hypothetical protein|nr:hypothetical protein [Treponema sp.]
MALAALFFALAFPAGAQVSGGEEFFIAPVIQTALFSTSGPAFGGGLAAGYGYDDGAMGLRALYFADTHGLTTLEFCLFLRVYPLPRNNAGFFVQVDAGTALFALDGAFTVDAGAGRISAGLSAGWRFPLGTRWYVEPSVRAGYPYIAGADVSAGFRF